MSAVPPSQEGTRQADERTGDAAEEPAASLLGSAPTLPIERRDGKRKGGKSRRRRARTSAQGSHDPVDTPYGSPTDGPGTATREYTGTVQVFGPHSSSMPDFGGYMRSLWARRQFIAAKARADVRGSKANTAFGGLWRLLDPMFQAALYYFLFTVIRGVGEGNGEGVAAGGGRTVEFLPILVAGVFLFRFATGVMTDGSKSVVNSKSLVLNSSFPRAVLPLTTLYRALLDFIPAIFIYVGVHVVLSAPVGIGLLWFPLVFVLLLIMTLGLALGLATITVYVRDMSNAMNYVTRLLFFASPVIYPVGMLPESIKTYLEWQPFFPFFESFQLILDGGVPNGDALIRAAVYALLFIVLGTWLFLSRERSMAIRL